MSDQLMLFAEGSLARTFRRRAAAQGLQVSGPAYGVSTRALLASYDPQSSSWKTSQLSLEGGLTEFSETWPRSGMMRNGIAFQLPPLALRTYGTGFGSSPTHSIPTPTAQDHIERRSTSSEKLNPETNKSVSLDRWVRFWPTPSASANTSPKGDALEKRRQMVRGVLLAEAVFRDFWPTPSAGDDRDRGNLSTPAIQRRIAKGKQLNLSMVVSDQSGALNPTWVEWLMGFPTGHTDLRPSETP